MVAREHGGGDAVVTTAWISNGDGKSEKDRAREWEWERAAAAPPFTPSGG